MDEIKVSGAYYQLKARDIIFCIRIFLTDLLRFLVTSEFIIANKERE